jgi:hypothetical protein
MNLDVVDKNNYDGIIKKIMKHIKAQETREETALVQSLKAQLGNDSDWSDNATHLIGELNEGNSLNPKLDNSFSHFNKTKHNLLDKVIINYFNDLNDKTKDDYKNIVSPFINELNATDISDKLNTIFNSSNKKTIQQFDNVIINSFNGLNNMTKDDYKISVTPFINELNATDISDKLNTIFNSSNKKTIQQLDNVIINSFNGLNNMTKDDYKISVTPFINELNATYINDKLGKIINEYELQNTNINDRRIVEEYIQINKNINNWLQPHFDLGNELSLTMKPMSEIAFKLGNQPSFLPRIHIGDVSNKIGQNLGKIKKIMGQNIPSLTYVTPDVENYDTYDVVGTISSQDGDQQIEPNVWRVPTLSR